MSIKKITIPEFIVLANEYPVFDVRSNGEYGHAHIPNANNLPLFSDEERKIVGTAYKKIGKKEAIKLGLDFFGVKMKSMVEEVEKIISTQQSKSNIILVHCWRGGMRSAGVAWLLDLYGFEVYTLIGGYKAFRNWVLQQFEKDYNIKVLGGYTGSAKTELLKSLSVNNENIIDLEGLACHKGSAFGGIGQPQQPSQEMFENKLAVALHKLSTSPFWIEDESQRIGALNIPPSFWKTIRKSSIYFIDVPFEERLDFIIKGYGQFEKEKLVGAIMRIQKRFGPLETKTAISFLLEDNIREAFVLLLTYYDKSYIKALHNRENITALLQKISFTKIDIALNTKNLLSFFNPN